MADLSGVNEALKEAIRLQGESQKNKIHLQTQLLISKVNSVAEMRQKKEMMPLELEQKRQEKMMPSAPTMSYKDSLFKEITAKPQDTWQPWEQNFVSDYSGGSQAVVDPATGEIKFRMPKGGKFQPKAKGDTEDMAFLGGEQPASQPFGRMKVKTRDGQTGTIDVGEFDPNLYEKI